MSSEEVAPKVELKQIPKIKCAYNPETISFETDKEFNEYYNNHKEEMDKLTTYQLNKTYKIKDLHIAKRVVDGVKQIALTREYYKPVQTIYKQMCENSETQYAKKMYAMEENIKQIQQVINNLTEVVNNLVAAYNERFSQ
jgi:hypothetical protein